MLLAQLVATRWFLQRQAKLLTREMLVSIERALLGLLCDASVLKLIYDVAEFAVDAAIAELVGGVGALAAPLRYAFDSWGGAKKVVAIVERHDQAKWRPTVRRAFDKTLEGVPGRAGQTAEPAIALESIQVRSGASNTAATTTRAQPEEEEETQLFDHAIVAIDKAVRDQRAERSKAR